MESQDKILELVEKVAKTIWEDEYIRSNPLVDVSWGMLPEWAVNTYLNLAKQILFNNNLAIIDYKKRDEYGYPTIIPLKEME